MKYNDFEISQQLDEIKPARKSQSFDYSISVNLNEIMSLLLINSVDGARHYFRNLDSRLVSAIKNIGYIFSWIESGNRTDHNLDNQLIMLLLARFSLN